MSKLKVEGVIFDMDGLLFDTEKIYYKASQKTADKYGLPFDETYYLSYLGVSDEELHESYYRDYKRFGRRTVAKFIEESYGEMERIFQEEGAAVKPGALELLDFLEEQGIPKIIASSNLRRFIELLLDKAKLKHRFIDYVSAEDVTFSKPHPEIVQKAVQKLNTTAAAALMLEDSLNGVRASFAADVPVIMIPDLLPASIEAKEKSLAVLGSLKEVPEFLS